MNSPSETGSEAGLQQLLERACGGDRDAAGQLITEFEPEVRRFVRFRLASAGLRRIVDSVDIAQSVFARFFVFLHGGATEFEDVEELRLYLIAAAKNAVIDRVRRERAGCRDVRRVDAGAVELLDQLPGGSNTPSACLVRREDLDAIRGRLSPEEIHLVDQWLDGRAWEDVARDQGRKPDAVRRQMSRALDRVAQELRLIGQPKSSK